MSPNAHVYEALVVLSAPLAARARGRDSVDLALACLALGWQTALLFVGAARDWLSAQQTPLSEGPDPFPRTLASLPLYELAAVHVLDDRPNAEAWPSLGTLPVQVLRSSDLPRLLRSAAHVLHP